MWLNCGKSGHGSRQDPDAGTGRRRLQAWIAGQRRALLLSLVLNRSCVPCKTLLQSLHVIICLGGM